MNTLQKTLLLSLSVIAGSGAWCVAQSVLPDSKVNLYEQQKRAKAARQARIQEPWNGKDQSFIEIRRSIDKAVAAGQNIKTLAARNKAIALKNPLDAQAQFRWGYAALKAAPTIPEATDSWRGLRGVPEAMWAAPSPRSYHYDRLLFLVENFAGNARELRPLGERLLRRNANDLPVVYEFIPLLQIGKLPLEKQRALQYAQQLLKAQPRNPRYLSRVGYIYSLWVEYPAACCGFESIW